MNKNGNLIEKVWVGWLEFANKDVKKIEAQRSSYEKNRSCISITEVPSLVSTSQYYFWATSILFSVASVVCLRRRERTYLNTSQILPKSLRLIHQD